MLTNHRDVGLIGANSIISNPNAALALQQAFENQNLGLINKNIDDLSLTSLVDRSALKSDTNNPYRPSFIIVMLDDQSPEQEQMDKWREDIANRAIGSGSNVFKQVFFIRATIPNENPASLDLELLSSEVIAKKSNQPLSIKIQAIKVSEDIKNRVVASLAEITEKNQTDELGWVFPDTELPPVTSGSETDIFLKNIAQQEEEEKGWIFADTELPPVTPGSNSEAVLKNSNQAKPTLNTIVTTQAILRQFSLLTVPSLDKREESAIKYLMRITPSSPSNSTDEYINNLMNTYKIDEQEKGALMSFDKFNQFLDCLRFAAQLEKWGQRITKKTGLGNAEEIVDIGIKLIKNYSAVSTDQIDKANKLNGITSMLPGKINYPVTAFASILEAIKNNLDTSLSSNDDKEVSKEEITHKRIAQSIISEDNLTDTYQKELLLHHLEKIQQQYKEAKRTTHTSDFTKLIKEVKKSANYAAALTVVQKEFDKQKNSYEKRRVFSRFLSSITKNPFIGFDKKIQEPGKDFQYPKLLFQVLERERKQELNTKAQEELQLMVKNLNVLLGQNYKEDRHTLGLNTQGLTAKSAFTLLDKHAHLQDPSVIKQIFPDLQSHLKLDDKKFSIVIEQLLANTKTHTPATESDIAAAVDISLQPSTDEKSLKATFTALALTIYRLESELESTRISMAQANLHKTEEEHPPTSPHLS